MSNPTATVTVVAADENGDLAIAANPNRRALHFSVPASTDDTVYVCPTLLADADATEGFAIPAGTISYPVEGYTGPVSVICAATETGTITILETRL